MYDREISIIIIWVLLFFFFCHTDCCTCLVSRSSLLLVERGLHATIFLGTRPAAVIVNPVPINALGEGASMIHIVILIQLGLPTCSSLIEALHRPGHQHIIGTSGGVICKRNW